MGASLPLLRPATCLLSLLHLRLHLLKLVVAIPPTLHWLTHGGPCCSAAWLSLYVILFTLLLIILLVPDQLAGCIRAVWEGRRCGAADGS